MRLRTPPRFRSARGAELVEFALVLPLLLVVVAGIIDFGFLFQRFVVLNNAAREGARIAVLPDYGPADVRDRVRSYVQAGIGDQELVIPDGDIPIRTVDLTLPDGGSWRATEVGVSLTHNYMILGPIMSLIGGGPFGEIRLNAVSTMRVEVGG